MELFNNLPLYKMDVELSDKDETGVEFVALVDAPAIKRGWLAFNEHTPQPMKFVITSEDRHIISGPLMLADTPIYRSDENGEYYVSFPATAIERIVKKFFGQGNQANVNEMHDSKRKVEGVVMFESWITDKSRGVMPMAGYEDAPEGSWFGSFQVDNDAVWEQIKTGVFTGFSVEGIFSRIIPADSPEAQNMSDDDWWNEADFSADERENIKAVNEALKNLA